MSKLTFVNLNHLIPDMTSKHVEKEHFSFFFAKRTIDCVFCICKGHFELLVGIHAANFGFVVNIDQNKNGNYIAELDDDDYFGFCGAVHLSYAKDGFISSTLLKLLSSHIPMVSKGITLPYEFMRPYLKCRSVDEADKIYFKGWNDHQKDGKRARNFDKTEFFLGKTVADYCRAHNISSIWTNVPREEVDYLPPFSL